MRGGTDLAGRDRAKRVALLAAAAALVVTAGAGARSLRAQNFEPAGPPAGKIRVANFFLVNGSKPGPPLDFYDVQQPSKTDKPLISHLGYGQISGYVSPRSDAGYSNLYIYPAGSKTWNKPVDGTRSGTNISNSGWVQGQQETVVMGTNASPNEPSYATIAEVEPPKSADLKTALLKPTGGKGLLVVNVSGLIEGTSKYGDVDLRIDGACPDNVDTTGKPAQDSSNPTTPASLGNYNAANFPLALGSHKLNVVDEPGPGSGLSQQQCVAAPAKASVAVKIAKTPPTLVFIYGSSPAAVKTLVAHVG
jgi:hypothetical protein